MILSSTLRRVGRGTGVAGGVVAIVLWGNFVANVVYRGGGGSPMLAAAMVGFALLAIVSAWLEQPVGLLVAFVASLVPVGLYLLGTPSIYLGIGLANLLYLAAALLLWSARRTGLPAGPD